MEQTHTLKLPKLARPVLGGFDTRPKAVRSWVEGLPMGNIGEATRRIYHVLRETNRTDIPVKQRVELLERLAVPVSVILPALSRHYVGKPFPLPGKGRAIARLSTELYAEMATGYRLILAAENGPLLRRLSVLPLRAMAVHRVFFYLGGVLANHRLVHRPYPKGIWATLNRLYLREETAGRSRQRLSGIDPCGESTTIEQEYKKILLLALLSFHQLRPEQLQEVEQGLQEWSAMTRLGHAHDSGVSQPYFCVQLDDDTPPSGTWEECVTLCAPKPNRRLLDTSKLVSGLLKQLESGGETIILGNGNSISRETVMVLVESWGGPRSRRSDRVPGNGEMDVAIGLSAVHHLMLNGAVSAEGEPMSERGAAGDLQLTIDGPPVWIGDADVWDSVYIGSALEKQSWVDAFACEQDYAPVTGTVVNQSETGYCISLPASSMGPVKIGELVGLRADPGTPWKIACVRWLQDLGGERVLIGTQLVVEDAWPAAIKVRKDRDTSPPIACLTGLYHDRAPVFIVPYLPGLKAKELVLECANMETSVTLAGKVAGSPAFEAYHIHKPDAKKGEVIRLDGRRFNPTAVMSQLKAPTEADVQGHKDEYRDIWASL